MDRLGFNIKKIREFKNYSQQYVAVKIGISQPAYSSIEKCKTKIDDAKLKRIADALEIDVSVILNFSEKTILQNMTTMQKINSKVKEITEAYEILLKNKDEEILSLKRQLLR